ncbi:uncharacterized protein [Desmodus rotundus]|uniref:uncharacterized protein n=1 Tax=Desmodus rotundus TaxID=9430 RepID=UPI001E1C0AA4|nr:uncharacterized protein LOC123478768 [Desmodus rotundus]XP_053772903.1 uncharacterized protein LOC128779918 [Desmodus rotundus]
MGGETPTLKYCLSEGPAGRQVQRVSWPHWSCKSRRSGLTQLRPPVQTVRLPATLGDCPRRNDRLPGPDEERTPGRDTETAQSSWARIVDAPQPPQDRLTCGTGGGTVRKHGVKQGRAGGLQWRHGLKWQPRVLSALSGPSEWTLGDTEDKLNAEASFAFCKLLRHPIPHTPSPSPGSTSRVLRGGLHIAFFVAVSCTYSPLAEAGGNRSAGHEAVQPSPPRPGALLPSTAWPCTGALETRQLSEDIWAFLGLLLLPPRHGASAASHYYNVHGLLGQERGSSSSSTSSPACNSVPAWFGFTIPLDSPNCKRHHMSGTIPLLLPLEAACELRFFRRHLTKLRTSFWRMLDARVSLLKTIEILRTGPGYVGHSDILCSETLVQGAFLSGCRDRVY